MTQPPLDVRVLQNLMEGITSLHGYVDSIVKKIGEVNSRVTLFTSALESLSSVAAELTQELPQTPPAQVIRKIDLECGEDDFL